MTDDFAELYQAQAELTYRLCCRLEGGGERAERLFADLWKRVYQARLGDQPCQSLVGVCRHLSGASRVRRGGSSGEVAPGLGQALLGLSPEFRLPLVLREEAALPYGDLASALEVPLPTVRARLARARGLLRPSGSEGTEGSMGGGAPGASGKPLDDELISAALDQELQGEEVAAVQALLLSEPAWKERLERFREDARALRELPVPGLLSETREIVYRSVTESFALGAERRRVPRYKRRWMLLAAFFVPCSLTLLYLQNPNHDSRLYLRPEGLVLRAGRSVEKRPLLAEQSWTSPPLWGRLEADGRVEPSLQVDAGEQAGWTVELELVYDFDGDGRPERVETYRPAPLDGRTGWERLRPELATAQGEWSDFQGGTTTLRLHSQGPGAGALELSGTAGEIVLPFRHLSAKAPQG